MQGMSYNKANGFMEGFQAVGPLNAGKRFQDLKAAATSGRIDAVHDQLKLDLATHASVWQFQSSCKTIAAPLTVYGTGEGNFKTENTFLQTSFMCSMLMMSGILVSADVMDAAQSNAVRLALADLIQWGFQRLLTWHTLQMSQRLHAMTTTHAATVPDRSTEEEELPVDEECKTDEENEGKPESTLDEVATQEELMEGEALLVDRDFEAFKDDVLNGEHVEMDDVVDKVNRQLHSKSTSSTDHPLVGRIPQLPTRPSDYWSASKIEDVAREHGVWSSCPVTGKMRVHCSDPPHAARGLRNAILPDKDFLFPLPRPDDPLGKCVIDDNTPRVSWRVIVLVHEMQQRECRSTRPSHLTTLAVHPDSWAKMSMLLFLRVFNPRTIRLILQYAKSLYDVLGDWRPIIGTILYIRVVWVFALVTMSRGKYVVRTLSDRRLHVMLDDCILLFNQREAIQEHYGCKKRDIDKHHLPDATLQSYVSALFGGILLLCRYQSDFGKVPREISNIWVNNDQLEHLNAFYRMRGANNNPTLQQTLVSTSHGLVEKHVRASMEMGKAKQRDAPDPTTAPLPSVDLRCKSTRVVGGLAASYRSAASGGKKVQVPATFDINASWPVEVPCDEDSLRGVDAAYEDERHKLQDSTFSVATATLANLFQHIQMVKGSRGAWLTFIWSVVNTNRPGVQGFLDDLCEGIQFSFRSHKTGEALAWGGNAFRTILKRQLITYFTRLHDLDTRMRLWKKNLGDKIVDVGSAYEPRYPEEPGLHQALSYAVGADAAFHIFAIGMALAAAEASGIGVETASHQGDLPADDHDESDGVVGGVGGPSHTTEGLLDIPLTKMKDAHAVVEDEHIENVAGWIAKALHRKVHVFDNTKRNEENNAAARDLIRCLDCGLGAHLDSTAALGPSVRLHVATKACVEFLEKLEYLLRDHMLTPESTSEHLTDLIRWVHWCLSRSVFLRRAWDILCSELGKGDIGPEVKIAVMRLFCKKYLQSRVKTHRVNYKDILCPAAGAALRSVLKAFTERRLTGSGTGKDPVVAALIKIIGHFAKYTNKDDCERGLLGLFGADSGIEFKKTVESGEVKYEVETVPPKPKPGTCYGNVLEGDVVDSIERVRRDRSTQRRTLEKKDIDLTTRLNSSHFPLLIYLIRTKKMH